MTATEQIAGVELGGTKAVAVLARGDVILARVRIATTSPADTLGALRETLGAWRACEGFAALGIASFGPLRLAPRAADHGVMLATPKKGWSGADIVGTLTQGLDCPSLIDTDVNAAARAEWRWGAGKGLESLCYMTIGTGLGGGILIDGRPIHGALHPEVGHIRLRRAPGDDFAGVCPFHDDCVEGLVAGPALRARFGRPGEDISPDDPRWSFVAHDLAALIAALLLAISPQKILIGGGIALGRPHLLDLVRAEVAANIAGYLPHISSATVAELIALPALGENAGPLGAIALGEAALRGGFESFRPEDHQ